MRIELKPLAFVERTVCSIWVRPEIDLLTQLNGCRLFSTLVTILPAKALASVLLVASQFFFSESEVQNIRVAVQRAQNIPGRDAGSLVSLDPLSPLLI